MSRQHRIRIISLDAALPGQVAEDALFDDLCDLDDGVVVETGRLVKGERTFGIEREETVCDLKVTMRMNVEAGTETLVCKALCAEAFAAHTSADWHSSGPFPRTFVRREIVKLLAGRQRETWPARVIGRLALSVA